jgi:histidine triad (HIT) family protein
MIPREHIESLEGLSPEHDALIAHMMRLLPTLAREQGLSEGFRTIINTGKGGGQEVFHLHIHLLGGSDLPGF